MDEKTAVIETEITEEGIDTKIDINQDGKTDFSLRIADGLIIAAFVAGILIEHFALCHVW